MNSDALQQLAIDALTDLKGVEITSLQIDHLTTIADWMVFCSGTSTRHVKALADNVVKLAKEAGFKPLGISGEREAEWVLVDLGDVVVHVMLPQTREFYQIEKLWQMPKEPS